MALQDTLDSRNIPRLAAIGIEHKLGIRLDGTHPLVAHGRASQPVNPEVNSACQHSRARNYFESTVDVQQIDDIVVKGINAVVWGGVTQYRRILEQKVS